jgi:hypothetical protein
VYKARRILNWYQVSFNLPSKCPGEGKKGRIFNEQMKYTLSVTIIDKNLPKLNITTQFKINYLRANELVIPTENTIVRSTPECASMFCDARCCS